MHRLLLLTFLLAIASALTQAAPIVQQPFVPAGSGAYTNLPSGQQIADDFTLAQSATIGSVQWWGRYDSTFVLADPVAFSIRFFQDTAGTPDIISFQSFSVTSTAVSTGFSFGGGTWFSYSSGLTPFTLSPGTYWVSIVENDPRTAIGGTTQWLWADTNAAGLRTFRVGDGSAWTAALGVNHSFTLSETPEPSTLLLGAGGLGFLVIRRSRNR